MVEGQATLEGVTPGHEVVLETGRLLPRRWRMAEAVILRGCGPKVALECRRAAHIDADDHATAADPEESIRTNQPSLIGSLAVERKAAGDVVGYCGLIDSRRGAEGSQNWHSSCCVGTGVVVMAYPAVAATPATAMDAVGGIGCQPERAATARTPLCLAGQS